MPRRKSEEAELPVRGKVVVPAKSVKKRPPARKKPAAKAPVRKRAQQRDSDVEIDNMDDEDPPERLRPTTIEGFPQSSRRTQELEAQMRARWSNEPIFPYPPELEEELRPYWVELVNSFPKDHFQVSDTTFMKMYCQCAYDIERQSLQIKEEGEVIQGARAPMMNPRCKVRDSNRSILLALATKFRNQPASRVNTENFKNRRQKAEAAVGAASAIQGDEDDLLASPNDRFEDDEDVPRTRH